MMVRSLILSRPSSSQSERVPDVSRTCVMIRITWGAWLTHTLPGPCSDNSSLEEPGGGSRVLYILQVPQMIIIIYINIFIYNNIYCYLKYIVILKNYT